MKRVDIRLNRPWVVLIELALVAGIELLDRLGVVPLSPVPFLVLLAWASLRLRRLRWRDVGLSRPPSWAAALPIGIIAGIAMELLSTYVTVPLLTKMTGQPPDLSDFRPLVGNAGLLLAVLVPLWIGSALEEMVFRGYLMHRIAGLGRGTPAAWAVSVVISSVWFGWTHGDQQITGMVQEGFAGLLLALLYLASRKNLFIPIVAHAAANTIALTLIYLGMYPGVPK